MQDIKLYLITEFIEECEDGTLDRLDLERRVPVNDTIPKRYHPEQARIAWTTCWSSSRGTSRAKLLD